MPEQELPEEDPRDFFVKTKPKSTRPILLVDPEHYKRLTELAEVAKAVLLVFDAPAEAHPADVASGLQYVIDVSLRDAVLKGGQ